MKKDIHPKYNTQATVSCACGYTFKVGSTKDEIKTELCSQCHPFYTGKQKLVDTARRVEKFEEKMKKQKDLAKNGKVQSKKQKHAKRTKAKNSKATKVETKTEKKEKK